MEYLTKQKEEERIKKNKKKTKMEEKNRIDENLHKKHMDELNSNHINNIPNI